MSSEVIQLFAKIAGIGGISIALVMYIFRSIIIQKNIFPMLTKAQAYNIINRIILATFIVALAGIAAWLYTNSRSDDPTPSDTPPKINTTEKRLSLSGIVTSKQSKQPIPGITVSLSTYNIESRTDSVGKFTFTNLVKTSREDVDLNIDNNQYYLFNGTFDLDDNNITIRLIRKG